VDAKRTWQLLPMYRRVVQESHGAKGYNWGAINIELAGVDFDAPGNAPPAAQTERAVRLTALLMDFYGLAFEHVVGHYERDDRGLKTDPGVQFMAGLREQLAAYRAARSPVKSILLSNA
jgi:N-acetyl-anhydromuramyl-L-alanine amidase AmpD